MISHWWSGRWYGLPFFVYWIICTVSQILSTPLTSNALQFQPTKIYCYPVLIGFCLFILSNGRPTLLSVSKYRWLESFQINVWAQVTDCKKSIKIKLWILALPNLFSLVLNSYDSQILLCGYTRIMDWHFRFIFRVSGWVLCSLFTQSVLFV